MTNFYSKILVTFTDRSADIVYCENYYIEEGFLVLEDYSTDPDGKIENLMYINKDQIEALYVENLV